MIKLDKIENQIDALLAEETPESLTAWLLNKRNRRFSQFLGEGTFVSIENQVSSFQPSCSVIVSTEESTLDNEISYLSAA